MLKGKLTIECIVNEKNYFDLKWFIKILMIYVTHVLTHIIYITHVTYIIYVPHMVKLALKANKKTDKIFLYNFFLYIKILTVNK